MHRTALIPANLSRRVLWILLIASASLAGASSRASSLDIIGLTVLRATTTNLDGTGIPILQVEAEASASPATNWEVNPAATGLPASNFVYYDNGSSTNGYPNSLGTESGHADSVGWLYYGFPGGVATNVAQVNNYEATYFAFTLIPSGLAINSRVVNQSFIAGTSDQTTLDPTYDTYAAQNNTLFVSAVGNGGPVSPPSTCYNGIGVGAYVDGVVDSSVGPTTDSTHRAKPDLTAPEGATSFSTPLVSGAAAILLQAALRGDGGSDTNSAADARALKALLINGAIKPGDWTNASPSPLDPRYGAGTVNVFESYKQLAGGKHAFIATTSVSPVGSAHPPTAATNNESSLSGWDFNTLTSGITTDRINHYYFNLAGGTGNAAFTATATLVWNRQAGQTGINDLNLYLYNTSNGNLVASSVSTVDNVEHLYILKLPAGRYDLQVFKSGGLPTGGRNISNAETYALAFEFFTAPALTLARSGSNIVLAWPVYPAGFALESTPALTSPITWTTVGTTPVIANNQNSVTIDSSSGNQFFRLSR